MTDTMQKDELGTGATAVLSAFVAAKGSVPEQLVANARDWVSATKTAVEKGAANTAPLTAVAADQGPKTPAWAAFTNTVAAGTASYAGVVCGTQAAAGGASEAEVLQAIALGIEIAYRVQTTFAGHEGVWDLDAVASRFGTTAAVGRLLGLTTEQAVFAFGVAAGQAAGLALAQGTWAETLIRGRAAADAVEACYLAKDGYDASDQIIEGEGGACDVLFPGVATDSIVSGLGTVWRSESVVPCGCGC